MIAFIRLERSKIQIPDVGDAVKSSDSTHQTNLREIGDRHLMMLLNSVGLFQGDTERIEKRRAPVMELLFSPLWFLSRFVRSDMQLHRR